MSTPLFGRVEPEIATFTDSSPEMSVCLSKSAFVGRRVGVHFLSEKSVNGIDSIWP